MPVSPIIHDIVIIAYQPNTQVKRIPAGEFEGTKSSSPETNIVDRLYDHIFSMIYGYANEHHAKNFDETGKIKPACEHNITRLLTNEFFFYTKKPLEIDEFQLLQQRILDLAKKLPPNFQMILSSFAVKVVLPNTQNKVMNVVATVECGPHAKMNFHVKNYPSSLDPIYRMREGQEEVIVPHICIADGDDITNISIILDGQSHGFSFNNVMVNETLGGIRYYTCTEICYDHAQGCGIAYLYQRARDDWYTFIMDEASRSPPLHLSHVLTSKIISIQPSRVMGALSQADPFYTLEDNPHAYEIDCIDRTLFGTPFKYCKQHTPLSCAYLPHDLMLDIEVNALHYIDVWIQTHQLLSEEMINAYTARCMLALYDDLFKAIIVAVTSRKTNLASALIQHARHQMLDINQLPSQDSLLGIALANQDVEMVTLLIDAGAQPSPEEDTLLLDPMYDVVYLPERKKKAYSIHSFKPQGAEDEKSEAPHLGPPKR